MEKPPNYVPIFKKNIIIATKTVKKRLKANTIQTENALTNPGMAQGHL